MAQVSQAINGNWALLVKAAMVRRSISVFGIGIDSFHIFITFQCPCEVVSAIDNRIRQSPIRFLISVINPLFKDRGVW